MSRIRNEKKKTVLQLFDEITDFQARCGEYEQETNDLRNSIQRKLDAAEALRGALHRTLQVVAFVEDEKCAQVAARLGTIISDFDNAFYDKD